MLRRLNKDSISEIMSSSYDADHLTNIKKLNNLCNQKIGDYWISEYDMGMINWIYPYKNEQEMIEDYVDRYLDFEYTDISQFDDNFKIDKDLPYRIIETFARQTLVFPNEDLTLKCFNALKQYYINDISHQNK